MSTCLKVLNEKTIAALRTSNRIDENDAEGTIEFLSIDLSSWKILSNKEIKWHERHWEPLKAPISDSGDDNLQYLKEVGTMASKIRGKEGRRRKTQTRDTSLDLEHTCNGLVELSEFPLLLGPWTIFNGRFRREIWWTKAGVRQYMLFHWSNCYAKASNPENAVVFASWRGYVGTRWQSRNFKCDFSINEDHHRLIE